VPEHIYVYPSYLRKRGTRSVGRRVPSELAVAEVTAEEIQGVARKLGYHAELESGKLYPRQAQLYEGRVKVTKKAGTTKTKLLREIATALRAQAPPSPKS
jgi:signal recognition particle subunit SRP19